MNLTDYIASIPDYPKEGILFRDVTPLMADGEAFKYACEQFTEYAKERVLRLLQGLNQEVLFLVVQSLLI